MESKYGRKVLIDEANLRRLERFQKWCDNITTKIKEERGDDWEECPIAVEFDRISACVSSLFEQV